jgi:glycosyltransferase involved in cell wall biosynthesis
MRPAPAEPEPSRQRITVGVAAAGDPSDPTVYSGVPASLLAALQALGVATEALPAHLGSRTRIAEALLAIRRPRDLLDARATLRRRRVDVLASPAMAALRSAALRRAIRGRHVDGLVQNGCEFRTPDDVLFVTYEDSTVVQGKAAYPWPHMDIGDRTLSAWVARQSQCYERAHACCTYNHWAADSIVSDYGQPRHKVKVVGVGINNPITPPPQRSWATPRYLFVGYDWTRKNGDRVVSAFARLRERIPEAELDLVGGHPRVDAPGVRCHGRLPLDSPDSRRQLIGLFQAATCFVMPSLHEPTGIVHAEAAAAGIASIGTVDGGVSTLIGEAGRVVDPRDDDAILTAMLELADPELARSLGALALERSRLFTWEKVAERLLRALELPGPDGRPLAAFL